MRGQLTTLAGAFALALPGTTAAIVVPPTQPKIAKITKQFLGPLVQADEWGYVQVLLVVRKTTTTVGTKKTVTRRIISVRVPVYPKEGGAHTIVLNQRVIPLLAQQALKGQMNAKIHVISEATDTTVAFNRSLQAALYRARQL